jgi:CRP-like cAMP-binding protein
MTLADGKTWLKERTALTLLSEPILEAIAQQMEIRTLPPQTVLALPQSTPDGLYILRSGEITVNPPRSQSTAIGMTFYLKELLLNQSVQAEVLLTAIPYKP